MQDILINCGGYVIVWLLFVAFVAVNDGVVVGDRSAHEVNFHPTQAQRTAENDNLLVIICLT